MTDLMRTATPPERPPKVSLVYLFPETIPVDRPRYGQTVHMLEALAGLGVDVLLMVRYSKEKNHRNEIDRLRSDTRFKLHEIRLSAIDSFLKRKASSFSDRAIDFLRHSEAKQPPILMTRHRRLLPHLTENDLLPVIFEMHDLKQANDDNALDDVSSFACISMPLIEELEALTGLGKKAFLLPCAADVSFVSNERPWSEAPRRILYCGGLSEEKGAEDLIEAVRQLPGYHVTIAGGYPKNRLDFMQTKYGTDPNVTLTGQLPYTSIVELLRQACIGVFPSRLSPESRWTSPVKVFEYLAAGCPVVYSDLPSTRNILSERIGYPFEPDNVRDLVRALADAAAHPQLLREKSELGKHTAEAFSWQARASRLAHHLMQYENRQARTRAK